jgi:inositol-hexakisphosphate kinase
MSVSPPVATSPLPASPVHRSTPAQDDELLFTSKTYPSPPLPDPITRPQPTDARKNTSLERSDHLASRASTLDAQSPQLSERESIFALHYTPSQDELNTPVEERAVALSPSNKPGTLTDMEVAHAHVPPQSPPSMNQVNGKQPHVSRQTHATFVPGLYATGQDSQPVSTSRPRIFGEGRSWTKKTPLPISKSGSARNSRSQQAMEIDIPEGVIAMQQPGPQTSDVQPSSLKQALQRRGSRIERSTSRGRSHIEKSIEATLANVEPGKNVRSRKASHVMGIFRENVAPGDDQKPVFGRQKSGLEPKEVTDNTNDFAAKHSSPIAAFPTDDYFTKSVSTPLIDDLAPPKSTLPASSPDAYPLDTADIRGLARSGAGSPTTAKGSGTASPLKPIHDPYFRKYDELKSAKSAQPPFPASLLQEIREHHNLLPLRTQGTDVASGFVKPTGPGDQDHFVDRRQIRAETVEKREDGEEHMYKMVYFPHPGPTEEEIAKFKSPGDESPEIEPLEGLAQLPRESRRESRESGQLVDSTPAEHIDIAVHSKHGKSIFHGDYYPVDEDEENRTSAKHIPSLKDQLPSAALSASESEPESADEAGYLSQTDDGQLTPTASRKEPSHVPTKDKQKLEGPKGAVVLQPYNHQVGGHSQIYALTKRAIMKQLNNRENEFYEIIEIHHPDMLKFLPRSVISSLAFLLYIENLLLLLTHKSQIHRCYECAIFNGS